MGGTGQLVAALTVKPQKAAHGAFQALMERSLASDEAYPYFDSFLQMMGSGNSYVRNRGLMLAARNARWDREGKLDRAIDAYLAHIGDEKPITARQCIQALPDILPYKRALRPKIRAALANADFSHYPDSMAPLLLKDAINVLKALDQIEKRE